MSDVIVKAPRPACVVLQAWPSGRPRAADFNRIHGRLIKLFDEVDDIAPSQDRKPIKFRRRRK